MKRRKNLATLELIAELLRAVHWSDNALDQSERLTAAIDAEDILSDLQLRALTKRREVQSGGRQRPDC